MIANFRHVTRHRLARLLGYIGLVLLVVLINLKTGSFADDVYITLTYARNIADGNGMVFNLGERVLGTTTPVWCWLHAFVFLFVDPLKSEPLVTDILFSIATFGAASTIERLVRGAGWGHWGFLGGAAYILAPDHVFIFGMETSLAVWLAGEMLLAWCAGRFWLTGMLGGILILTRPDAGCLFAVLCAADALLGRNWRRLGKIVLPAVVILVPILFLFKLYFGHALPNTLGAKKMLIGLPWVTNVAEQIYYDMRSLLFEGPLLNSLAFAAGIIYLLLHARRSWRLATSVDSHRIAMLLVPIWAVVQISALGIMGIPYFDWYAYPVWMMVAIAIPCGTRAFVQALAARGEIDGDTSPRTVIGAAVVVIFMGLWMMPWRKSPAESQQDRYDGYVTIAKYLNERPPGPEKSVVYSWEIGVLKYYMSEDINILDDNRLVHEIEEDMRPALDSAKTIERHNPRFIVESQPNLPTLTHVERENQLKRLQNDFIMMYTDSDGQPMIYSNRIHVQNTFGIQNVLEYDPIKTRMAREAVSASN